LTKGIYAKQGSKLTVFHAKKRSLASERCRKFTSEQTSVKHLVSRRLSFDVTGEKQQFEFNSFSSASSSCQPGNANRLSTTLTAGHTRVINLTAAVPHAPIPGFFCRSQWQVATPHFNSFEGSYLGSDCKWKQAFLLK